MIKSLGPLIKTTNGLSLNNSFSEGRGYRTGERNIKNVVNNVTALAVSRNTQFTSDNISDKPTVRANIGISANGKKMMAKDGLTRNTKNNITIRQNLIRNSNID